MSFSSFFNYSGDEAEGDSESFVLLGDWTEEQWGTLLEYSETLRLKSGDVLVDVGDVERVLFIVGSGDLEVVVGSGARKRALPVGAGELIGEVGFFDGLARTAQVVAVSECEVHRLTLEAFEVLAVRHAELGRELLLDLGRILANRLRSVESLLER